MVPDDPDDPEVMPPLEDMSYTYTTPVPPIASPPQIRLPSLDTPDDPYAIFNDDEPVLPARPGVVPMPTHFSDATLLDPQRRVNDYSAIQLPVTDAGNLSVQSEPMTETPRDDVTIRDTQSVTTAHTELGVVINSQLALTAKKKKKKKKKKKSSSTDSSSPDDSPQVTKLEGTLKPIPTKERIIPTDDGTKHVFIQHEDNFLPVVTNEDRVQHGRHISETAAFRHTS